MKHLLAALICSTALLAPIAEAATPAAPDPAAVQALRDQIRTDKKKLVADNMLLTAAEADKFWPLYDQYEKAGTTIRQRLTLAMIDFIAVDAKLTNANAKRLIGEINGAERDLIKLRVTYFDKMSKVIPAAKAARFMQIEAKIDALQRFDQAATIPLAQ